MGESFNSLGKSTAESILFATSNPFIGLFIGLLITAIIQSSSTSTTMIVAVVSAGSITISDAVPMIMGANIGTTLTSTIVALGYITNKNEFRRALAAGTIHDFFNILTVLILFPLEYKYGLISYLSQQSAAFFVDSNQATDTSVVGFQLFDAIPITKYIVHAVDNGLINILLSFTLLFVAIKVLSKQISKMLIAEPKENLKNLIFSNPFKSFGIGAGLTAAVQSSSITTSLVIPFVAKKKIELKNVAPFILGANIGTTITAFIAVLFKSNAAVTIAMTHFLFNVIGVLIFLPFPAMRNLVILIADRFGVLTFKHRLIGFTYIIFTFFAIPFALIYFNKSNTEITELTYLKNDNSKRIVISNTATTKKMPFLEEANEAELGSIKDDILHVSKRNNILFFNNDFFIFNDIGFCWDAENDEGKYQMCITDILESFSINKEQRLDSIYVFDLTFYNSQELDSVRYQYLVSPDKNLLLKRAKISKMDSLIFEERLSSYQIKY